MALPVTAECIAAAKAATSDPDLQAWLLAIAVAESRCSPTAVGPNGENGLLQFYRHVGLGGNYSVAQLNDPYFNMRLGADYISRAADRRAFMRQHWTTYSEDNGYGTVPQLYDQIRREGILSGGGAGSPGAPTPASPPVSGGGFPLLPLLFVGAALVVLLED